MFSAMLGMQWKSTRSVVFLATLLCFAAPVYSLRMAAGAHSTAEFLMIVQGWSVVYALLSAGLGLVIALSTWAPDHRGNHVYALTLPLPRWRYVLLRFGTGLVALSPAVVALGAGTVMVAWSPGIPQGLHVYPLALTLRFALAALVSYAIFFAISSATGRTAAWVFGGLAAVVIAQIVASSAGSSMDILGHVADVVFAAPGLLAVFGGRWMLIDV